MKKLFFLFVCLCCSSLLFGQLIAGQWGISGGYTSINTDDLKGFMPAGVDPPGNQMGTIGFESSLITPKWKFGFDVTGDLSPRRGNDSLESRLTVIGGNLYAGYTVINKPDAILYPMIGLGGGGSIFRIYQNGDLSASQIQQDPRREVELRGANFMVNAGVGVDFPGKASKEDDEWTSFTYGIRVGYRWSLPSKQWRYEGGRINDAPEFGPSGLYIRLFLGWTEWADNPN